MLETLRSIVFCFFAASTGFISDKRLPKFPKTSFNITFALWAVSYTAHYLPQILSDPTHPVIGAMLNIGFVLMIGPKYGLPLLMGWIFTDCVFLVTGVYMKYLDWWLLIVYTLRSKVKLPEELKK